MLAIRDECTAMKNHIVPFPSLETILFMCTLETCKEHVQVIKQKKHDYFFCLFVKCDVDMFSSDSLQAHILLTLQILHDFCIHVCLHNFIMRKCLFFVLFGKYSILICLKRTIIIIIYLNYNSV